MTADGPLLRNTTEYSVTAQECAHCDGLLGKKHETFNMCTDTCKRLHTQRSLTFFEEPRLKGEEEKKLKLLS